ncbi:O-antigen ligase family protein [Mesorhizobium sp. CAU 1732]|uniref:O-antigen ligase family protein n=1 Tax=Mesorhizobium sp. CAU 1732 TaxID=3140358 RepID=UPI0032607976
MTAIDHSGIRARKAAAPIITDARAFQLFLITATIVALPLNWFLGTSLPWIFGVSAFLAFGIVRLSLPEWQLVTVVGALLMSLLLAMIMDYQGQRALAALYNIALMLIFILFINHGRQIDNAARTRRGTWPKDAVYRAAFYAYLAYVFYMVAVQAWIAATGTVRYSFDALLLGRIPGLPGILELYVDNVVVDSDWIAGAVQSRIHGMGVYATESAMQVVLLGLIAVVYLIRKRRFGWAIAAELSILPMLIPFGSRTTGLAYVASLLLVVTLWRGGLKLAAILLGPVIVAGLLFFASDIVTGIESMAQSVADARAGSTESRMATYQIAVRMVLDQNLLMGLGIKPQNEYFPAIPIGSHSSVVSVFTRAGLIGLILFLAYYATLLVRIAAIQLISLSRGTFLTMEARLEMAYLSRIVFVVLVWCLTEDLDAPIYHAMLSGLAIGIFWNMSERLRKA